MDLEEQEAVIEGTRRAWEAWLSANAIDVIAAITKGVRQARTGEGLGRIDPRTHLARDAKLEADRGQGGGA